MSLIGTSRQIPKPRIYGRYSCKADICGQAVSAEAVPNDPIRTSAIFIFRGYASVAGRNRPGAARAALYACSSAKFAAQQRARVARVSLPSDTNVYRILPGDTRTKQQIDKLAGAWSPSDRVACRTARRDTAMVALSAACLCVPRNAGHVAERPRRGPIFAKNVVARANYSCVPRRAHRSPPLPSQRAAELLERFGGASQQSIYCRA